MTERKKVLESLLNFEKPINQIQADLKSFPWDSNVELVLLSKYHLINIFKGYLGGFITNNDMESWANIIEGRDDIGFESKNEQLLREVIHDLANPLLTQPLTEERAGEILKHLTSE